MNSMEQALGHAVGSAPLTSLLAQVAASGWTEERASQFEREYGDAVRRLVVLYLWRFGLVAFRFDPSRARRALQAEFLELFENTLSDVWIALTRGLVRDYIRELGARPVSTFPFMKYLAGTVHNLSVENARSLNLLPRESESALLRGICASRKVGTQKAHLARAMWQLQTKVERELFLSCRQEDFDVVYPNLYRLVHHFFECYVPSQCPRLKRLRGSDILAALAREYMVEEFRSGLTYTGTITPWDPNSARRVLAPAGEEETDTDEEDFLSLLALREENP